MKSFDKISSKSWFVLLEDGDYDEAIEELLKERVDLSSKMARDLDELSIEESLESADEFSNAISLIDYHLGLAHEHLSNCCTEEAKGKIALLDAKSDFEKAILNDGKFLIAYYHESYVLHRLDRVGEALIIFRQAEELKNQDNLILSGEDQIYYEEVTGLFSSLGSA